MLKIFATLFFLWVAQAYASATRTIDADALTDHTHTNTAILPSRSGNVLLDSSTVQEVPTGTCNGSTTAFTLANTPSAASTVVLHQDGLVLTQGAGKDYTISGSSITLASACATGQTLWASYAKQ